MVWIVAALLLGSTLFVLISGIVRSTKSPAPSFDTDVEFYRAQMLEIRRQGEAGAIAGEEERAAATEAARRLIGSKTNEAKAGSPTTSAFRARVAALTLLIAVPSIAVPVYALLGSPDQPDMALAQRPKPARPDAEEMQLAMLVARIEQQLARSPDDRRGLQLIAPLYLRLGRNEEAVDALKRLIGLNGGTPALQADLGEAMVARDGGLVGPDAKQAFAAAFASDAQMQKPRFYLGRAAAQAGDAKTAESLLKTLLAEVQPGPIQTLIEQELAGLASSQTPGRVP